MQEYSPCMKCEYYNKPYWSVVSPCKSCTKIYGSDGCIVSGYITTDTSTIIIKNDDNNYDVTHLPTAKEYSEAANKMAFQFTGQWSEPKYQCPECGSGMCKNLMITLTSYLAQYEYQCDKCGHIEYQYM